MGVKYISPENLLDRILTEADLCRNEGAEDIAELLDDASKEIGVINSQLASAERELQDMREQNGSNIAWANSEMELREKAERELAERDAYLRDRIAAAERKLSIYRKDSERWNWLTNRMIFDAVRGGYALTDHYAGASEESIDDVIDREIAHDE